MKTRIYYIRARHPQHCPQWEVIDDTSGGDDPLYMIQEYRRAFGPGWIISSTTTPPDEDEPNYPQEVTP